MATKLTSRQQAQLAFLATLPPKLDRSHAIIEQMAGLRADDAVVRSLTRMLDEIKANAQAMGLTNLGDTAGTMAMIARRGGGMQVKVRGLRELLGSLKINYDGAVKVASTPQRDDESDGQASR